jgi:DNA-binding NtrC family response regulator
MMTQQHTTWSSGPQAAPDAQQERGLPNMIGQSATMRRLARSVRRLAPAEVPVMVRGESGTGKELGAAALHCLSDRSDQPFVAINGATIGEQLGASALFGHARGAFTGAATAREGAFRRAHRGTLFIDEVGALPPTAQAALLRAVEEGVVMPLGDDSPRATDVRLVVATCEPIERMVARGEFRADLYQRLSVCVLWVPALRERRSDIRPLAHHLLQRAPVGVSSIEDDALELLSELPLTGNVRELRNLLVQAALGADGPVLRATDVAEALRARSAPSRRWGHARKDALALLARTEGNISRAARLAGVPRSTFRGWIAKAADRNESQKEPTTPIPCSSGLMMGASEKLGPRSLFAVPPSPLSMK